jgi:hypothetical protein
VKVGTRVTRDVTGTDAHGRAEVTFTSKSGGRGRPPAGQFVMALDTTVINTVIATVAKDVGTTVAGIQTAITLYTLVMASLMIWSRRTSESQRAYAPTGSSLPARPPQRWGR